MNDILDVIAGVLIRCFLIGTGCIIFWLVMVTALGDWAYHMHSAFIPISREQFNFVHYNGMVMFKTGIFSLFLLPWIGIKMVQKKRKG